MSLRVLDDRIVQGEALWEKGFRMLQQLKVRSKLRGDDNYYHPSNIINATHHESMKCKSVSELLDKYLHACCFLCNPLLQSDLRNTTMLEGRPAHLRCHLKLKHGQEEKHDSEQDAWRLKD